MTSNHELAILEAYEKPSLFKIKPFKYEKLKNTRTYDRWKILNSFLKTSDDPYIKFFEDSFYQLYNGDLSFNERTRFYADHTLLRLKGKLIKSFPIENEFGNKKEFVVDVFELNNLYYLIIVSNSMLHNNVLSSYSGIFNLIEYSQKEFISNLLINVLNKKEKLRRRKRK